MKKFTNFILLIFIGFNSYSQVNLENGLIAKYLLNNDALDASVNGLDGTLSGCTSVNDRNLNPNAAYNFSASVDSLITPVIPGTISSFSYGFWLKTTTVPASGVVIFANRGLYNLNQYSPSLYFYFDGTVEYSLDYDFVRIGARSTLALNDGNWHHIVGTWLSEAEDPCLVDPYSYECMFGFGVDNNIYPSDFKLYIDGSLASVTYDNIGNATLPVNSPNNMVIGGNNLWTEKFEGDLDDIYFYNRALTADEANALYLLNEIPTNISGINTKENFEIYPNPTNSSLTIDFQETENTSIEILNNLGQVIYTKSNIEKSNMIDLSDFANGIYFAKVNVNGEIYNRKIVKE